MKITPVLFVDSIEKSLPFWVDRFGFEKTVEVPEGGRIGFVILVKDGSEVMLQTFESARKDAPALVGGATCLFIEVDDFEAYRKKSAGGEVVLPERVTFYGMREIGLREPNGHIVVFAAQEKR